jgi:hypothetical protein
VPAELSVCGYQRLSGLASRTLPKRCTRQASAERLPETQMFRMLGPLADLGFAGHPVASPTHALAYIATRRSFC